MTRPDLPLFATAPVTTGDERAVLEAFLDYYRDAVTRKVRGVSEEDSRRRLVPSLTTLAGLVHHLRHAEAEWFQGVVAGGTPVTPASEHFVPEEDETVGMLLAAYGEECERSRETAAALPLDHLVTHPRLGQVSLRWVYVHMVEETARHAGHADILRELLDGTTGH